MHPHDQPEATGNAGLDRPRGPRRVLSLAVASVLAAAALVNVSASGANADGTESPDDVTACSFDGEQHLEIFVEKDGSVPVPLFMDRWVGDDDDGYAYYYWEYFWKSSLGPNFSISDWVNYLDPANDYSFGDGYWKIVDEDGIIEDLAVVWSERLLVR